jgi:hypothetical protein
MDGGFFDVTLVIAGLVSGFEEVISFFHHTFEGTLRLELVGIVFCL